MAKLFTSKDRALLLWVLFLTFIPFYNLFDSIEFGAIMTAAFWVIVIAAAQNSRDLLSNLKKNRAFPNHDQEIDSRHRLRQKPRFNKSEPFRDF